MEIVNLFIHTYEDRYLLTPNKRTGVKGTKLIGTAEGILRSNNGTLAVVSKPQVHDYVSDTKNVVYQLIKVDYND